ncbi:MAG: ABC transporter substrate-binding protein [Eubacteriales bacterium]|nr:ABC transporter substrate-binding protein [Clostridiales bacterium]
MKISFKFMKKLAAFVFIAVFLTLILAGCGADKVLYVYNWGEYISDGSEGTLNVEKAFEKYYYELTGEKLDIRYTTYPSNEDLYAKMSGGGAEYDVIFPSDYMVERMIAEGLLEKLNLEAVCEKYGVECLYSYIDDKCKGLYYDPTNEYSVPYTYGRVGIIYNKEVVDKADIGGWDLMWNEKYAGKILQFNNSRDAFATAHYKLGYSVNTTNKAEWQEAYDLLLAQKSIIQGYVMDEVFNKMESGEAAIAPYYAGDYFIMRRANENLGFYYPENTNIFVDAMCIPKGSRNPEIAALFINFMLSEEIAIENAKYIFYASPNSLVYNNAEYREFMGEEAMEVLYPEDLDFSGELAKNGFRNLDPETLALISSLWEDLKITGGIGTGIYIVEAVVVLAIIAGIATMTIIRKKRRAMYE